MTHESRSSFVNRAPEPDAAQQALEEAGRRLALAAWEEEATLALEHMEAEEP